MKHVWSISIASIVAMLLLGCAVPTPQVIEKEVMVTATPVTVTAEPQVPQEKQIGGNVNVWLADRWPEQSWLHIGSWQSHVAIGPMAEWLFRPRADGKLEPELAESYDVSDDGLTYTLHLRQNVKWHDGAPFTSADVVYTYQMWADPNLVPIGSLRYGTTIRGFQDYQKGKVNTIDGLKIVDDYTVQFILSSPDASLPYLLWTYSFRPIVPKHVLEKLDPALLLSGKDPYWTTNPIGTGPYKFVKYVTDQYIEYERNDNYWGGAVGPEKLFMKISNAEVAIIGLQKGEIDLMFPVPVSESDRLIVDENVELAQSNQAGLWYGMEFNYQTKDGFWQNPKARQAFLYATDRSGYLQSLFGGKGFVVNSWFDGTIYACPTMTRYDYNPDKAMQLFDEIGMTAEKRASTTITLLSWLGLKQRQEFLPIAQANLRTIGFKVNVVIIDNALTYEYNATQPWDAHVFLGGPGADPASIAPFIKSDASNNLGARGWPSFWETFKPDPTGYIYNNAKVDELLDQGMKETNFEERKLIYQQIDCIWNEELPAITTVAPADLMARSKRLQGVDWANWAGVGQINNPGLYRPFEWWIWQKQ
jgi:peptide/nickel transport system substrate-binding protein